MSSRPIYALTLCALVTTVAPADILITDTRFNPANYNNFFGYTETRPGCYGDLRAVRELCCGLQAVVTTPSDVGGVYVGFLDNTFRI